MGRVTVRGIASHSPDQASRRVEFGKASPGKQKILSLKVRNLEDRPPDEKAGHIAHGRGNRARA